MYFSTQDLWYAVASGCLVTITILLSFVLYRLLNILRQTDEMVTTARQKITLLEETIELLAERLTSISGYASLITEGGRKIASLLGGRSSSAKKTKKKSILSDEDDE